MKQIEIQYNPYKFSFAYYCDGEPVTAQTMRHSQVLSKQGTPFHVWCPDIFTSIDKDINSDYELIFTAREVEQKILKQFAGTSRFCKKIMYGKYAINKSEEERLKEMASLTGGRLPVDLNLPIYTDDIRSAQNAGLEKIWPISLMNNGEIQYHEICEIGNAVQELFAFVLLYHHEAEEMKLNGLREFGRIYVIAANEKESALTRNGNSYRININLRNAEEVIQQLINYEAVPYLLNQCADMAKKQGLDARMLLATDCVVEVKPLPKTEDGSRFCLELGTEYTPEISWYPIDTPKPQVWFDSDNPIIIRAEGGKLIPVGEGFCTIIGRESGKTEPIYRETVHCIRRNRIREICVEQKYMQLAEDMTTAVQYSIIPMDADNTDQIRIVSSDPDIVMITPQGELHAMRQGGCMITIEAEGVKTRLDVDVLPKMQGYQLSKRKLSMLVGQREKITIDVIPQYAYFAPYSVHVMMEGIVDYDMDTNTLYAIQPGRTTVRFVSDDGEKAADLTVKVAEESSAAWIKVGAAIVAGIVIIGIVIKSLFG